MFAHGRNIAITGGNFVDVRGNSAFKELQKAAAPSAFHNSSARFDPPKCHPNTRVAILEYLMGWIFGRNDPEALILWLYGPAGAGKSAILQTIAERCFERKALLASFFFGRSDSTRNTFKPLISTIVYQIAIALPEIKHGIETIIEHDPLIFDKSIATQLQSLIVGPLKDLAASGFFNDPGNCARLILIDGLDECNDPRMQNTILRALADALRDQKLPLVFLIASRPEQHLTLTFNSLPLAGLWHSLVLNNSFEPDDDIRLFLEDSFREIKSTHPHRHLIPDLWPEPSDVDDLVWTSSGQFIYASVVIKYISTPVDRPHHRLEVVMGLRPLRREVPFSELDALYMHILDSCDDPETVLLVLGLVICGNLRRIDQIEMLMDLKQGDVEIALAPLTSIINLLGDDLANEYHEKYIQLCHASFGDFLVDSSRSGRFHINTAIVEEIVVGKCLSKLMDPQDCLQRSVDHPIGPRLLGFLDYQLDEVLHYLPSVEKVEHMLKAFSLPRFWSSWSPKSGPHGVSVYYRMNFVNTFLRNLSPRGLENSTECEEIRRLWIQREQIYAFHLSSFESIFKTELQLYYQDVGLMALVLLALFDEIYPHDVFITSDSGPIAHMTLFRLTEELMQVDFDTFRLGGVYRTIFLSDYEPFFTGPKSSAEACLDGGKYAECALRILEFLCGHPPHPIPYRTSCRKHQTPKPHSNRTRTHGHTCYFPSGKMRTQKLNDISLPRKRREEKHRRGVALSFQLPDRSSEDPETTRLACELGLSYLPMFLRQSSKSSELVVFIRTRGKDVVFIPERTRKAIRAMYEYLEQWEEDAIMVNLSAKFKAMVID